MNKVVILRCAHCGAPIEVQASLPLLVVECNGCKKPSLFLLFQPAGGTSLRLDAHIMSGKSDFSKLAHIEEKVEQYSVSHPEIGGLNQIVTSFRKKLRQARFTTKEEQLRLSSLPLISDLEVATFIGMLAGSRRLDPKDLGTF